MTFAMGGVPHSGPQQVGAEPQGFTVEMEGKAGPSCLGRWVYDPPRCLLAFLVSQKGLLLS